jgi:hypothetical protein
MAWRSSVPLRIAPQPAFWAFAGAMGIITSYANSGTAQGSAAPGELGRASASKFRRMPMRSTPTETAPTWLKVFECFASTGVNTPETMFPMVPDGGPAI